MRHEQTHDISIVNRCKSMVVLRNAPIMHGHWHNHTTDNAIGLYVCVHPVSEASSAPPINHQTLSQLSIALLVTLVGIGMVWLVNILGLTHRHWDSCIVLATDPPPKPVTI